MPRRKLSEYKAKRIIATYLENPYTGWDSVDKLPDAGRFVVKVDQAVKKRFKNGLVGLDLSKEGVSDWIEQTKKKGYSSFIIEPFQPHENGDERYLSVTYDTNGLHLVFSKNGGVNIEDQTDTLQIIDIDDSTNWSLVADKTGINEKWLRKIIQAFKDNYFTLLEINPYILKENQLQLLDVAVEVDDAASLLVEAWHETDLRQPPRQLSREEENIAELNETSPASFSFQIMNPNGSLFILLSGGGASVTICDEVYSAGCGEKLANYGEYSGNPTEQETYIYTSAVLRTLLQSKAPKRALLIGGAVANFTDISKTFAGVTKAIEEYGEKLKEQGVRVVVRRGGPNQEKGLNDIRRVLDKYNLNAAVYDPSVTIDTTVAKMLQEIA